ncbi:DNA-packaging protein gp3 [Natranaerovirga pectinivora]|uniref:DNA-packaging protein gp3 n=1 Tax=Natranaerovirga pectinivora TaxID=682400 RepID=A0A4R3MPC9_9FIRM|nr:terminase small subunit [Natranaerovirga pectinivora]TCT16392.1 DNA-packaging protein gp3 [Natranaerovirga pectinivora]
MAKKGNQGNGGGKPLKWGSPEELEQYIQEYFEWTKKNDKHITVTGLAWWLGCSKQTIQNYEKAEENDWLQRLDSEERRRYVDLIKDTKRYIEMEYEERLYNRSKATGGIFSLKNLYGWVDKQEVVNTNKEIIVDIIDDDSNSEEL